MSNHSRLLETIAALPPDWHDCGSLSARTLRAIAGHCSGPGMLDHSLETGCGKSTLLFSHISRHHVVFSIDAGRSLSQVRSSPLLNTANVEFVVGPTQTSLPQYKFKAKVQAALLDGPHAYPFPDLEYYYIYQVLAPGAILIVDDIHIPTLRNMCDFLKSDDMFAFLEEVEKTAFFERTDHEMFSPLADGWPRQGYNRGYYERRLKGQANSTGCPRFMHRLRKRMRSWIQRARGSST